MPRLSQKFRSMGFNLIEIELPEHSKMDFTMVMYGEANAALRDPIETQPTRARSAGSRPGSKQSSLASGRGIHQCESRANDSDARNGGSDVEGRRLLVPFDYADYTPNPVATLK